MKRTILFVTQTLGFKAACGIGLMGDVTGKVLLEHPEFNFKMIYADDGYARVEIFAALAETYRGKEEITKIKDSLKVHFFNEKGEIVSKLTALYGEINNTKGTLMVRDSVRLYNYEKKQTLETEALYWNQKDSTIYSKSSVKVRSPKGTIFGEGIKTKQDFSKYEIIKPVGKFQLENELEFK